MNAQQLWKVDNKGFKNLCHFAYGIYQRNAVVELAEKRQK